MLLHRGNHAWRLPSYWLPRLDRSFPRKLSTGLFWLSARSLLVQPDDSAVQSLKAILAESHSQRLHIYDVVGSFNQSRPPGLILSLIHDLGGKKERMVEQLHSLPPVSSGVIIDAWQEKLDAMKQDLIEAIKECNTTMTASFHQNYNQSLWLLIYPRFRTTELGLM